MPLHKKISYLVATASNYSGAVATSSYIYSDRFGMVTVFDEYFFILYQHHHETNRTIKYIQGDWEQHLNRLLMKL